MGQRHQAFLIAQIPQGDGTLGGYRCLAAFHHQWCYGRLPLRATRRFLTLAKQPINAAIIREELKRISEAEFYNPERPSHYLSSLLACAFNFGLEEKYPFASGVRTLELGFLRATIGCWDGDNNNGLSIIDITNPERGAYCFLLNGSGPMAAEAYARTYYPGQENQDDESMSEEDNEVSSTEKDVVAVIHSLAKEPLVSIEALTETWPTVFEEIPKVVAQDQSDDVAPQASTRDLASELVPSLTDLILLPSIKYALANDVIEPIESIVWMPGKANAILGIFKSPEFDPIPNAALPLLAKALDYSANKHEWDASHLSLREDQILSVIAEREDLRTLNISYNPQVTITTVHTVLSTIPGLKRLILFGTSIKAEEWNDLLTSHPELFFRLESLIHPCFYEADKAFYPYAFAFICQSRWGPTDSSSAVLPFFTPTLIVEALSQMFVSQHFIEDMERYQSCLVKSAAAAVVLSHEVLGADQCWRERAIPFFAPPISKSLKGGWIFFMTDHKSSLAHMGFIKREVMAKGSYDSSKENVEPPKVVTKAFDLLGFLSEMEREGRPKAPVHAVQALKEAFAKLTNPTESLLRTRSNPYQWLTQETAEKLFRGW